ncbi:phospho-N-acetylmuramoyl-pentapeptide-transferase [candidate division WOR-3 bacterium]|uniref:Phospho-N-acetylmuramoyl-pentapeptide-transferase n=1 Tax=candidate division WOR-3 bacterium TaxID=2052148 RepID=A0A660SHI6_UNCW3|nr:MAG: phospho-N-acetylmuramoyl-pentapeptide-transferase [candidate division WOR-3 bacterium]
MLYHLLYPLREFFSPLRIFGYITFRAANAGVLSLLLILIFGPQVINLLKKYGIGERIREDLPHRHKKKEGTPTMGGLLVVIAVLIATLLFCDLSNPMVQILLIAMIWFGLLGFYDDYIKTKKGHPEGIRKRVKLIFQFLYAIVIGIILYKNYGPTSSITNLLFIKNIVIDFGYFYPVVIALVIAGTSNGVNLTDGLDGLAIGVVGIASATLAILAYISGHAIISRYLNVLFVRDAGELAIVCLALTGASLGFLWFNAYPAQIFMGDVGSLTIGGIIGTTAVLIKQEILLILVGGVFVIEALSVLIQVYFFRTQKRRVFLMAPLHHHFELKGWPEPKIVVRFWIIAVLFGLFALATLKVR